MSTDPKSPAPSKSTPAAAPAAAAKPKAEAKLPPLDERKLKFDELAAVAGQLDVNELVGLLIDGRSIVRANASLGLAAAGHAAPDMVPLLRDSDGYAAGAAAEALARLGTQIRPLIPAVAIALGGSQPEVVDRVVGTLADLIGSAADDDLIAALDVPLDLAEKTVLAAAGRVGRKGIVFLIKAAGHDRMRIRFNAISGIGFHGKVDIELSMGFLTPLETTDPVPDIRAAIKQAMLRVIAREKQQAVDHLPKNIPDFEARKLSASELREQVDAINIDEMMFALLDGRDHVKINAARALAVKGDAAGRAAAAMGLVLRDSVANVRKEAARALGKVGVGATAAAADLVRALGDSDEEVVEAAAETLTPLADKVVDALIKGLDAGTEPHGLQVGMLIGKLPNAAEILAEAMASPAVNTQVNAALGLGLLGPSRVGVGLKVLHGARTGGDGRTRAAVRRALDQIEAKGPSGPKSVAIDGFEDRVLPGSELDKGKAAIEAVGAGDLIMHLEDGRDVVRANAASALGVLGPAAVGAARSLGVRLRDDNARVRMAAAHALDKIGDAAVTEAADDLVGALGDTDDKVAEAVAKVVRARKAKMISALVRGLESDKPNHGRRICELINVFEDAAEILCDAIESAAVNVQVNAALGLGMLGNDRVGKKGRKALESRRTGGDARTNKAALAAIEVLDGPRAAGPQAVAVDGFESRILGVDAFGDGKQLKLDDLVAHLADGRPVVRANAVTALGALGPAAAGAAAAMAVLLRDDDSRVRIAAGQAIDRLGDDAVREVGSFLVGALRGDPEVAKAVAPVLAARKAKLLTALIKGLETDDAVHAWRICELVGQLPDACEILCDAFESPAENVQVNAAIGIGMLGAKRAGTAGRKLLEGNRTRGFSRTKEAVFKALAMLDGK